MTKTRKKTIALACAGACALGWLTLSPWANSSAQGVVFPDPNANCPPSECGHVSPLIPMQSAEAVHMGLVWKKGSQHPKVLFHARFPEYTPNDMADPALTELAIARGALTTAGNQFNSSLRDVLHGFDPFLGLGQDRSADDSFQRLTYGGRASTVTASGWMPCTSQTAIAARLSPSNPQTRSHRPGRSPRVIGPWIANATVGGAGVPIEN